MLATRYLFVKRYRVAARQISVSYTVVATTYGRCHQYTRSTCVKSYLSDIRYYHMHHAFEYLGSPAFHHSRVLSSGESLQKLELPISDKVVGKNRYLSGLQRSFSLFLLCFHCFNNINRYIIIVMPLGTTTN